MYKRAPYWLNGMVPLSFLLKNETNLMEQATKYVTYIMSHQTKEGWLGPDDIMDGNMYWSRFNVLNSFRMYCEGVNNSDPQTCDMLKSSMLKYILNQHERMYVVPLQDWSAARYMDFILSVHWLIENGGSIIDGYQSTLFDVAQLAHSQGMDWEWWFDRLPTQPVAPDNTSYYTHGVNNAQAFKSAAVWFRQTANDTLRVLSETRLTNMDMYHGQATGMFGADEHLAGRMPSRGTELCAVVEYMFSFQIMFSVFGDVNYLDRLERVAVNALPATFASPTGGDMWAHQYLQQVNEINAIYSDPVCCLCFSFCIVVAPRFCLCEYAGDVDSTIYGLEPNYGCWLDLFSFYLFVGLFALRLPQLYFLYLCVVLIPVIVIVTIVYLKKKRKNLD
ncbi:hypothetical protein RFI_34719 [Reticulomyxa filosa]|uniref:Non-reducing end beta-L-arabinofuranosidase-like GH127 catalytic domain-containing protein n=1 Tax=Reticulomyxa filosa TaxID=46433 RepID=X6LM37_RETFI|nr:hypothetical protein RFI_34719 [Reticulomyxa filosa]|eukprot:ETO02694.1 hypothetical protein RFI_34719 [Reticulomyxa filosa]